MGMKPITKERPILFSGAMVIAILNGSKTQTRRAVKLNASGRVELKGHNWHLDDPSAVNACPYGQPGDRLWVKETHLPKASGIIYRADYDMVEAAGLGGMYGGWKPSIFCKREYSRILLEIVSVRIERLQEITPYDAVSEGLSRGLTLGDNPGFGLPEWNQQRFRISPADAYQSLWESINGPESWDANPFVWVIEFKRVEGGDA